MSVNDLTELISPAFTEETIFQILKKKTDLNDFKILAISIDNAGSKKGDSYLSTICRFLLKAAAIKPDGENQTISVPVIVKYIPKNVARQKTFRSVDFFDTEIYFYEKVWPEMKKLKADKCPNDPDEIPLLLASYCDGKTDFIALEDLSYQGFKPCGRNDVITREKLSVFLQTLANFHALGIATRELNPDFKNIASNIPESYFADRFRPWYENFMYKSMGPQYQKAAKAILPEEYHEKFTKFFSRDIFKDFIDGCTVRDKLCSVTEGDSWLPNFLQKTNKDGRFEATLIDFQLARYAPITNDLMHFLYCGVPNEMLLQHWDDFIKEYHHYLSKRIEELGGQKDFISLKEINEEIQNHPYVGVLMALESTVMSLLTDEQVADLDFLKGENAIPLEDVWILPEFDRSRNERLAFLVKHFVDKGFIP